MQTLPNYPEVPWNIAQIALLPVQVTKFPGKNWILSFSELSFHIDLFSLYVLFSQLKPCDVP